MARKKQAATVEEFATVARRQAVLGDPSRLRILGLLHKHGPTSVTTLTGRMETAGAALKQPTVSHHLSVLLSAKLVAYTKVGRGVTYTLSVDELANVAGVEVMDLLGRSA